MGVPLAATRIGSSGGGFLCREWFDYERPTVVAQLLQSQRPFFVFAQLCVTSLSYAKSFNN